LRSSIDDDSDLDEDEAGKSSDDDSSSGNLKKLKLSDAVTALTIYVVNY